ncbi:FAD-dependent oxidoreductase [Frigidibacter sp. MR17.14]|uniref:NAD(P)/FAD-dependent oxidoreductase n=1 Tax=Frigidibacter sp. MR17.14 TaxID=3126509 RepID=UPI003012FF6A
MSRIAIIGAGPAGLAAATELARRGQDVTVLDREAEAGGIPRHCGHRPFGMREFGRVLTGPAYAARLVARARAAGVTIRCQTTVTALLPGATLTLSTPDGIETLQADRVLIATGVRETSRATRLIGGTKPGGVISTGALQGLVHLSGAVPFRRPVILGTEMVAFSALLTCHHAGIRPVAMIEPSSAVTARWPAAVLPRLMGVPLRLDRRIAAISGGRHVTGVTLTGGGQEEEIACDGVIVTGGFRPESALIATSHLEADPRTGAPIIDQYGRCSDPAYFATGNLLHPVETAGWCWAEGRRAAQSLLASLDGRLPEGPLRHVHAGAGLRYAIPQRLAPTGGPAMTRLQLRATGPATRLTLAGAATSRQPCVTRAERRLGLDLAALPAGDVTLTLETP